jgi:hypothetical protein
MSHSDSRIPEETLCWQESPRQELEVNEQILSQKPRFLRSEHEGGRLCEVAYEYEKVENEAEIEDVIMRLRLVKRGRDV